MQTVLVKVGTDSLSTFCRMPQMFRRLRKIPQFERDKTCHKTGIDDVSRLFQQLQRCLFISTDKLP